MFLDRGNKVVISSPILGHIFVCLCLLAFSKPLFAATMPSSWQQPKLHQVLVNTSSINTPGQKIVAISDYFLDAPYKSNTLIGNASIKEQFVARLDGFDCFTFLDAVEALRRSTHAGEFPSQLKLVRYKKGIVAYRSRRHFFSDWVTDKEVPISDVTAIVGQGKELTKTKHLNLKTQKTYWLDDIPVIPREITFIPSENLHGDVLEAFLPGDYIGIFTKQPGLDVSHTGLIVKKGNVVMLRHASSRSHAKKIIDEPLIEYMQDKAGLLVYRVTQ